MRKRLGLRPMTAGLITLAAAVAMLVLLVAGASGSVTGAVNTTDDPGWNGPDPTNNPGHDLAVGGNTILGAPTQACLNGGAHSSPAVNCNIYAAKTDVFISGSPNPAALGAGTYFFAVLAPGGQPDPNDTGAKNLSVVFDAATNREFSSDGSGGITPLNSSTHAYDALNNVLQVAPYADTPNPGGVYILAACKISDSQSFVASVPTVQANGCKYDAFKVRAGTTVPPTVDLIVAKTAFPTASFTWDAKKVADKTLVRQSGGGSVVVTYTASYTPSGPTDSINGEITVTNPNTAAATNVAVTDALDDGATTGCTVNSGSYFDGDGNNVPVSASGDTIPGLAVVDYSYTCAPPDRTATLNTATATWDTTGDYNGTTGTGTGTAGVDWSSPTLVDNCVNATDVLGNASAATLATLCVDRDGNLLTPTNVSTTYGTPAGVTATTVAAVVGPPAVPAHFELVYKQTLTVPANGCGTFTNTADFVTNTNGLTDGTLTDNSVSVTICPTVTGLTIGYWANKNGQGRISGSAFTTNGSNVKVCNLDGYLRGTDATSPFYSGLGPFHDLSSTVTCAQAATYVYNVIKGATCASTSKSCNTMLKAQLLATALNVYFGVTNGSEQIDLVHGCAMIDSTSGTATCTGPENWSSAFGGATHLSVFDMLHYAATQDASALLNGLTSWYGQVKATQVLAKDAFDAINNGVALSF